MSPDPSLTTGQRWSASICVLLGAALWVGPYLLRPDLFSNDVAHHVFWLYQYSDPGLYPGDPTVAYFQTSAPWGYRAIYAVAAQAGDVLLASKWLAFALFLVSGGLVWALGKAVGDRRGNTHALYAVVALALILPLSQQQDLLPPIGFQRTFALPLLLLTLWALVSRRYAWVGISWLLAALLYPVTLPVQGLAAGVVFAREWVQAGRLPPHWIWNGVAGAAAVLVAAIGVPVPPDVGPAYTYAEAIRMPEFGPGGRLNLYYEAFGAKWLTGHRTGLGWSPTVLIMLAAAVVMAVAGRKARLIPFAAWAMAGVGVALWAAMRLLPDILMFGLYLPNRHSRWALGAFAILAFAAGAAALHERLAGDDAESTQWRRITAIVAPLVVLAVLLPGAIRLWQQPVDADLEAAYNYLASLPRDTLIAAHPDLANFVPIRSRHSVLASTEVSMAWMQGYYARMKPRLEASLRAAYATRIDDVDSLLEPYGVDVMLTGPSVWVNAKHYFVPFDGLVRDLVAAGEQSGFVLQSPPAERVLFRSGDYYVIRVGPCRQRDCR